MSLAIQQWMNESKIAKIEAGIKVLCDRCAKGEAKYLVHWKWNGKDQESVSCGNNDNGCPCSTSNSVTFVSMKEIV